MVGCTTGVVPPGFCGAIVPAALQLPGWPVVPVLQMQFGGVPVESAGHVAPPPPITGGAGGGVMQFGGVPTWPAAHVVAFTGVGRGTRRRQFGGVPTSGGVQVVAATQFGGVPVLPGPQNFLLP